MPSISVGERAHRILNHLKSYRTTEEGLSQRLAMEIGELQLQPGESIIGIYDNRPGSQDERIVVTTVGLHVSLDGKWRSIVYADVERNELPREKLLADTITIVLKSGGVLTVPVRGGDEKFRDVFEFVHFLDRVTRKNASE